MKRILFTLVVLCGLSVMGTKAQSNWVGPQIGINIAKLSGDYIDPDSRTGIVGGAAANFGLSEMFSIRTGLLYAQKGASTERTVAGQTFEFTQELDYLEIPANAQLNFGDDFKFYARGGPYVGINILAQFVSQGESRDISDDVSTIDFGVNGGAGALYPVGPGNVILDVNYALGLADINDNGNSDNSVTNTAIGITTGYMFSF